MPTDLLNNANVTTIAAELALDAQLADKLTLLLDRYRAPGMSSDAQRKVLEAVLDDLGALPAEKDKIYA